MGIPEQQAIPAPRYVPAEAIKDADFFLPAGTLTYGDAVIDAKTRGIANAVVWARVEQPSPVDTSTCIESPTGWFEGQA